MSDVIVTTEEIDAVLKKYAEARAEHERAKEVASQVYKKREEAEAELMLILSQAGKSKWDLEGVGSVSSYETMTVKVPEDPTANKALFDYVVEKHGLDFAMAKFKMHSATLQSYYGEEYENADDKALFDLPGVLAPVAKPTLRFKRA